MTDPKPEPTTPEEAFGLHAVEETIEPPLTDQDLADLESLDREPPSYHTILEVWSELLKPAEEEQTKRVQPGWGSRITQMYPQIKMQHMTEFRDRYFAKILELKQILDEEIAEDPDCFKPSKPEDDAADNRHHYKNLLLNWQKQIIQWELDWDCEDDLSPVELGAISEVHKMFFSEKGVTAYLDNIGFEFDEQDQLEMSMVLNEMKEDQ